MSITEQRTKPVVGDPKHLGVPCFITYTVSCRDRDQEPVELDISPFSILIGATAISINKKISIEEGLSLASINIFESIESQYTILGFKQNGKER